MINLTASEVLKRQKAHIEFHAPRIQRATEDLIEACLTIIKKLEVKK